MLVEAINRDVCKRNDILHDPKQLPVVMSRALFSPLWFIVNWLFGWSINLQCIEMRFFYQLVDTFVNVFWHSYGTLTEKLSCIAKQIKLNGLLFRHHLEGKNWDVYLAFLSLSPIRQKKLCKRRSCSWNKNIFIGSFSCLLSVDLVQYRKNRKSANDWCLSCEMVYCVNYFSWRW